jgi:hypothetical protein
MVPRASGPIFMFCAPELIFGGTEGVQFNFHVLRSQTHFGWYRGRWIHFSCFVIPDLFLVVPSAPGPLFMFSAPEFIFDGTKDVVSTFHVLRSWTRSQRYIGWLIHFLWFLLPYSFSAVSRVSSPILIFCTPRLILCDTKGIRSTFHVLCSQTHFRRYWGWDVQFSCFARYRGLPNSFWAVPTTPVLIFIFCTPGLVFNDIEGVKSNFYVLRSLTCFSAIPRLLGPV